ncbi:MAG: ROK family transcriptional regulator [Actinobacteria bacterium]|nr:ROK family transcriptional regulator [Actinomycetota bacterium]
MGEERMTHTVVRQMARPPGEATVLEVLLRGDPMTRAQICAATGLSRPTVIDALARMAHRGIISVETRALGATGRNPELISIDTSRAVGLAADVGGSKAVVALVDLAGRVLAESVEPTAPNAERLAAQLAAMRREVAGRAGVPLRSVVTAVVGLPGVIDETGRIAHGGNIAGLDRGDVRALLRRHLKCPVTVENDVNIAGVGELDADPAIGDGTFVLVSIGTGLGMAVLHEGRVIRGATGRAGEIAFLPLFGDLEDPIVRGHGSAETMTSGSALERRWAAAAAPAKAEEILARAADGDAVAVRMVVEFAADLARVILSVASVLDPVRVVLGGGLGANPLLLEPVRAALARIAPFPIEVVTSRLGNRSGLEGAMALARRDLRDILRDELAVGDERVVRPVGRQTRGA